MSTPDASGAIQSDKRQPIKRVYTGSGQAHCRGFVMSRLAARIEKLALQFILNHQSNLERTECMHKSRMIGAYNRPI